VTADLAALAGAKKINVTLELMNHVMMSFDLMHHGGKAYAVYKSEAYAVVTKKMPGYRTTAVPPPRVAQPFGAPLRRHLVGVAFGRWKKALGRTAVDNVMSVLETVAFSGPETPLALRFHHDPAERRVTVDLGRPDGMCVRISANGWGIGEPPAGVVFRRSHATKPLPPPERGGTLDGLAELLAVDPGSDEFRLLLGWALGLPFAASVRPGLLLTGPPGTGKSTRVRLLASLWEPSGVDALGACFGQNHGDDQVRAVHRSVPLWDNLTGVSYATSDLLCALITGSAREGRQLYTNSEMDTQAIQRPIGLTAVGVPAGLRADALDRLVIVEAPVIASRQDDAAVQDAFDRVHPQLLGAACDAVSAALRHTGQVWPGDFRMAAYAQVLAAVDSAGLAGVPAGLLEAYAGAVRAAKQRNAADDAFGSALLALLEQSGGYWSGRAAELLTAMAFIPGADRFGPGWPKSAQGVPTVLNHLRSGLAELGVTWTTTTVRGSTRYTINGQVPPLDAPGTTPRYHPGVVPGASTTPRYHPQVPTVTSAYTPGGAEGGGGGTYPGHLSVPLK
jgi:energy-coupling factor transporter ATP-binding protein EcfA2